MLGTPGSCLYAIGDDVSVLSGDHVELDIGYTNANFTGKRRRATTVNGSIPGPTLRWREGDEVTIRVTNRLDEPTSIHWHGILLPYQMDGVPGISFDGIAPGESFTYRFRLQQSGTYWYHSHSGFQEQTGLYGALIVDPREPEPFGYDRDYTLLLSDWTDDKPQRVLARLKKQSEYYNFQQRTLADVQRDIEARGWSATRNERRMWNLMRMSDRDIADVTGYGYTYLLNGQPPASNWRALFERNESVRLRLINGSAMTIFDFRIPDLEMQVVAADGQNVEPVTVDEMRIGVAETYDVLVRPRDDRAYTLFAQSIDRLGYARGTLTPDASLTADVPRLDPVPILSHVDMGMAVAMGDMEPAAMDRSTIDHSETDHAATGHGAGDPAMITSPQPSRRGPEIDMRAENPQARLGDPGVGLRDRSWRVLTYGDLRSLDPDPDRREPTEEIELHLTGNMARYMWSFDGIRASSASPISLAFDSRVRFTLVNDTMMNHPIHLHGMWSELETDDASVLARKHTVIVQPGQKLSYQVTADAHGPWAFHCHLLFHMASGMFRVVEVS